MKRFGRAGSTFATIVVAAVVLALVSTTGAVAGSLITSKRIKNNTIKSIDVRNGNLTGVDVKDGSLTGHDVAGNSLNGTDIANGSLSADDFTTAPAGIVRGYVYSGTPAPPLDEVQELTSDYIYNSAGGVVTRTRTAVGRYSITFNGLDLNAGNVQVTAYSTAAEFCKVTGWGTSTASVACFDAAGAAADSQFTLAFIR